MRLILARALRLFPGRRLGSGSHLDPVPPRSLRPVQRRIGKAEELLGRAEQVYGETHGDAAATLDGEARRLDAEADEEQAREHRHPDDDGLAGAR